jgi:hypothetical protein
MSRVRSAFAAPIAFIGREWKFLACFFLALYVGLAVEQFFARSSVSICIGYWGCRG